MPNQSDNAELLPCPMCGSHAHVRDARIPEGSRLRAYWVECVICEVGTKYHDSAQGAVTVWNTRALLPVRTTPPGPLHFRHPADGEEVEQVKCEVLDCNESQSCFHYCHEHHIAICRTREKIGPASPITVPVCPHLHVDVMGFCMDCGSVRAEPRDWCAGNDCSHCTGENCTCPCHAPAKHNAGNCEVCEAVQEANEVGAHPASGHTAQGDTAVEATRSLSPKTRSPAAQGDSVPAEEK